MTSTNTPPAMTFGQLMDHYADRRPDEIALRCCNEPGPVDEVSRKALRDWSDALALALMGHGVGPGIFVPILLPTSVTFLAATLAIYKAGGTPMPVSDKLPAKECEALLDLAKPVIIVTERPMSRATVSAEAFRDSAPQTQPLAIRQSAPIKALASGGSTGKPKLIVTTGSLRGAPEDNLVAHLLRFKAGDIKYSPGPLYHNGPFWFSINMLMQGGSVLLNSRFDADNALTIIEQFKPTILNLVPTMMQRMLRSPRWNDADMSSVRCVWHLAAPCPAWAKEGFIGKLGGERILELWAATESTGLTVLDGNEWLSHRGSVGRGVATEIKILDDERNEVGPGTVGEIFTRFAGQPANYIYLGSSALETVDAGFSSVGDLGWLDEDGYLYLADRRTDLIISGGANIFPAEVESVLSQHPLVKDVAVIGLLDEDLGRRVHAIVEVIESTTEGVQDELMALCSENLARYKVPRTIEFVATLPRNEAGKIRRAALREERGG